MGSGILLAALVVLWIVVLVPMLLRRGDEAGRSDEGTHTTMRVLHRRGSESRGVTGEAVARLTRPLRDPRVEADVVARRRRTLIGLVALALLWAVLALFVASYLWTAQIVLDLMVFGYLAYLRLEAQREAERKARRKMRFPERPVSQRPFFPMADSRGARPPTFSDADVTGPLPAVPGPPPPVAGGWTPNPVPVPTYVNKAMAPRRQASSQELLGLDEQDPDLAHMAEWQGKRAVGD